MISLQFAHMRFFLVVLMCDVWFVVCMLGVRVIANWRLAYIIVVTSELVMWPSNMLPMLRGLCTK